MKRFAIVGLVGLLVMGIGLTTLAGNPLLRAHGEIKTELHLAGQWFHIQLTFNVQDRGEDDHGNLSMRIFDNWTGKLIAVCISHGQMEVYPIGDWVFFATRIRTPFVDETYYFPFHIEEFWFQAYDGGADDQFRILNAFVPVLKGKICVK